MNGHCGETDLFPVLQTLQFSQSTVQGGYLHMLGGSVHT